MNADGLPAERLSLVDLLDRLLAGGVVLTGDLTLRIADVDLVRIDLRALISSVDARVPSPWEDRPDPAEAGERALEGGTET
ncbi:gas vesicle protein [Streptomyces sp. CA-181903]|uniref:gas vesicle protein n=1 Tax=Streptomyces sp. CA-181903 TaxID=3240055 RepID=UPI003D8CF46A